MSPSERVLESWREHTKTEFLNSAYPRIGYSMDDYNQQLRIQRRLNGWYKAWEAVTEMALRGQMCPEESYEDEEILIVDFEPQEDDWTYYDEYYDPFQD